MLEYLFSSTSEPIYLHPLPFIAIKIAYVLNTVFFVTDKGELYREESNKRGVCSKVRVKEKVVDAVSNGQVLYILDVKGQAWKLLITHNTLTRILSSLAIKKIVSNYHCTLFLDVNGVVWYNESSRLDIEDVVDIACDPMYYITLMMLTKTGNVCEVNPSNNTYMTIPSPVAKIYCEQGYRAIITVDHKLYIDGSFVNDNVAYITISRDGITMGRRDGVVTQI